ncbi:MAG: glycosyltransferase family 2 protein [Lachnospiraceae bacterium]|nr:glycosyltransferase family 2 protein [Lachnospiraceae bacterium]
MSEQTEKKISIIIPCYNVDKYIDRCINSLVAQTLGIDALQLILVDDASQDRTPKKLAWWAARYPQSIEVILLPENRRQGGARNEGWRHAVAPYIGFVDSDDWVAPEMYELLYQAMEQEECDFVTCCGRRTATPQVQLNQNVFASRKIEIKDEEARKSFLLERLSGGIWSKLFRREFLEKAAPEFPEQTAYEDNYWMAMLRLQTDSCYLLGRELYYYYANPESTILQTNSKRHLERLAIEEQKLAEYKRRGVFETYYREFEYEFLRLYYINSLHTFFLRFSDMSLLPFSEMQRKVKEYFPDYRNNPYLERFLPLERELLKTIELELSNGQWEMLAEQYRKEMS